MFFNMLLFNYILMADKPPELIIFGLRDYLSALRSIRVIRVLIYHQVSFIYGNPGIHHFYYMVI